jgi:hypothetical protein
LVTGFLGTVGVDGLVTLAQSPQSTTELVRNFDEKFMRPEFPAALLQLVAATAT